MQSLAKQFANKAALARGTYLLAVLLGSYGVIWMLTGCAGVVLSLLGLARSEAAIFSSLLGFFLYPVVALSALTARRPLRFWGVLAVVSVLLAMFSGSWGAH